jgi:hypothetical protein
MKRTAPLLYRKDGSLDFGPLMLVVTAGVSQVMFLLDAAGVVSVSVAAWAFQGAFVTMAFIAGATQERAMWIAQSKTPGDVARAIASAPPLDTDSGRDVDTAHLSRDEARRW